MKNTLLAFLLLLLFTVIVARDGGVNAKFRARRTFYDGIDVNTTKLITITPPKGNNDFGGKKFEEQYRISGQDKYNVQFDEKLIDILTTEGEPGWLDKVNKVQGHLKNKTSKVSNGTEADTPSGRSFEYTRFPSTDATRLRGSLDKFGTIASRASRGLSEMKSNWAKKPFPERSFATVAIWSASKNIGAFANAGKDPMGAVVGAVNMVAAFAGVLGPTGMIVSMGFGFLGGILSLFGKGGEKPKSVGEVVREQINEALDHFYDQTLSDEAQAAIETMRHSKAFLDGVATNGEMMSDAEANSLSCHVPVYRGLTFMSKLAAVIKRLVQGNKPKEAKKCLKYIELYCTIATIKNMILQQFASLLPESHKNIRSGVYAQLRSLESAQVSLLSFLYKSDPGNKIMPYFDPDTYVVTDAYVLKVLKVPNYSRWLAGTYCLTPGSYTKSLVWSTQYEDLAEDRPYVTFANGNNCYWKLVPHGKWLFSIVNTKKCPQDQNCGALLSFDGIGGGRSRVTIDHEDPVLWSIGGTDQKRIVSRYGCNSRPVSQWCGKELGIAIESASTGWFRSVDVKVGSLLTNSGGYIWWITKTPRG